MLFSRAASFYTFSVLAFLSLCMCQETKQIYESFEVTGLGGSYTDPNHPGCPRICTPVMAMDESFSVYGADAKGGEGVPCDGETDEKWGPLPGRYMDDSGKLVVDFSSKGGPSDLTGYLNITSSPPQIQWEDGNVWPQKSGL